MSGADKLLRAFVAQLHAHNATSSRVGVVVTGGGASCISYLLCEPGASSYLTEANVPYSYNSVTEYLGGKNPEQFCSAATAVALARAAHRRAKKDAAAEVTDVRELVKLRFVGVGCTASLVSASPKRGDHRAHVAAYSGDRTVACSLTLAKGRRERWEEDDVVGRLVVRTLGYMCGLDVPPAVFDDKLLTDTRNDAAAGGDSAPAAVPVDRIEDADVSEKTNLLHRVYDGTASSVLCMPHGDDSAEDAWAADVMLPPGTYVFSGSFNPLHVGHVRLAETVLAEFSEDSTSGAEAGAGAAASGASSDATVAEVKPFVFEIAVVNADKPPMGEDIARARIEQFGASKCAATLDGSESTEPHGGYAVAVTRCPLFVQKAELFPGCIFVIGYDTAVRLVNPKYYHDSVDEMARSLSHIRELGCKFVVAGRASDDASSFLTLADMSESIPSGLDTMFAALPEEAFRADLSSTAIRAARAARAAGAP